MLQKKIFITVLSFTIIYFAIDSYHSTAKKAIEKEYGKMGQVISLFENPSDNVIVFKYRQKNGEETLIIGSYSKRLGGYQYIGDNELALGLSNNVKDFLTNYFYVHPKNGYKYLYGIVNKPENVHRIKVSYQLLDDRSSKTMTFDSSSEVMDNMFILRVEDNVDKAENWLFSFYDNEGELIKSSTSFYD